MNRAAINHMAKLLYSVRFSADFDTRRRSFSELMGFIDALHILGEIDVVHSGDLTVFASNALTAPLWQAAA